MSTSNAPSDESNDPAIRLAAERDLVEISPAQPSGPDRIDADGEASSDEPDAARAKSETGQRMKH